MHAMTCAELLREVRHKTTLTRRGFGTVAGWGECVERNLEQGRTRFTAERLESLVRSGLVDPEGETYRAFVAALEREETARLQGRGDAQAFAEGSTMTAGQLLREFRRRRGLSAANMAAMVGWAADHHRVTEQGRRAFTRSDLERLADAFLNTEEVNVYRQFLAALDRRNV